MSVHEMLKIENLTLLFCCCTLLLYALGLVLSAVNNNITLSIVSYFQLVLISNVMRTGFNYSVKKTLEEYYSDSYSYLLVSIVYGVVATHQLHSTLRLKSLKVPTIIGHFTPPNMATSVDTTQENHQHQSHALRTMHILSSTKHLPHCHVLQILGCFFM